MITVITYYFNFIDHTGKMRTNNIMAPKRLGTIKHTLDNEPDMIPPKVTNPEDELKRSFFAVAIRTLFQ
jgi:hypothetical protein